MGDLARRLGDRIRARREALGLSQKDLAERAGFSAHQIVSQIEKGQREVKAWELAKLSQLLHVSMLQMLGEQEIEPTAAVLWRKQPEENQALREAEFLASCRRYHQLETLVGAETRHALPSFSGKPEILDWRDVSTLAEHMSRELSLGVRPAASIVRALEERYGVKIWYLDLGKECSAACAVGDFGSAILMNRSEAPWRRNFNFAHELFHIITWNVAPPAVLQSRPDLCSTFEQFANKFASNLLLPADTINAEFDRRIQDGKIAYTDLIELVREFDVSTEALVWRLVTLNRLAREAAEVLLKDENFRALDRSSMHGRWWDPPPIPERFVRLAFIAYQKAKISRSRLAEYLETNLLDLNKTLLDYGLDESADYDAAVATA